MNDKRIMNPEIMNTNGFPLVYSKEPINGPTTLPIESIVCLAPIIFPLLSNEEYLDNSFCSKGVIIDFNIE